MTSGYARHDDPLALGPINRAKPAIRLSQTAAEAANGRTNKRSLSGLECCHNQRLMTTACQRRAARRRHMLIATRLATYTGPRLRASETPRKISVAAYSPFACAIRAGKPHAVRNSSICACKLAI